MDLQQFAEAIDKELDRIGQEREHWLGLKTHVRDLIRLRAEPAPVLTTVPAPSLTTPLQTETLLSESITRAAAPLRRRPSKPLRSAIQHSRRARRSENGQITMRRAVLQVLVQAGGEPLQVDDVLHRALALGATTDSKNRVNAVESQLYLLKGRDKMPVEKVGQKTWRWAGPAENELQGGDASRQEELIRQEAQP